MPNIALPDIALPNIALPNIALHNIASPSNVDFIVQYVFMVQPSLKLIDFLNRISSYFSTVF